MKTQFGIQNSFTLPLYSDVSKYSDSGTPAVLALPETLEISVKYWSSADAVIKELDLKEHWLKNIPDVKYQVSD